MQFKPLKCNFYKQRQKYNPYMKDLKPYKEQRMHSQKCTLLLILVMDMQLHL